MTSIGRATFEPNFAEHDGLILAGSVLAIGADYELLQLLFSRRLPIPVELFEKASAMGRTAGLAYLQAYFGLERKNGQ